MFLDFLRNNPLCIILVVMGLLAWAITIGARISSKRTGHYVSGLPGLGGLFILIGFLTSSFKWPALIGLLDLDLWYFVIKVIPDIIKAERAVKKYVPPEEVDGGKVIEYSNYSKEFEELRFPTEYPGSFEIHRINQYIIISKEGAFVLLKTEVNIRIIERISCKDIEECKKLASPKAKWERKI